MKFTLNEYSEIYFKTICKTNVPPERGGKFVQIENDDTEFLVLSPAGLSSFHASIVESFCMLHKIRGKYITKRLDNYEIVDPGWIICVIHRHPFNVAFS
ncbi:MAG TPA: hypothetical protein VN328_09745 [Thermodesulfovibrionales bacterium]|nr:hypothetical protein [Thermodesulfovibrionales bacterium]